MSLANLPPSPRAWSAASSRLPIPPSSWVLLAWSLLPPAYTAAVEALLKIDTNPYVTAVISVAAICALCADSIGGVSTFSATLGQTILGMGGVDAGALHRLTLAASTTFDSMPHNGSLNVTMGVMGLTHKDVYKNILVVQIGVTCSLYSDRPYCCVFSSIEVFWPHSATPRAVKPWGLRPICLVSDLFIKME